MRHKHRVRQIIINYLLSFILLVSIVTLVFVGVGKYTFASERAILHSADKTHYFYYLKNEMEQKAIDYAIPFGIDKSCIRGIFVEKEVRDDVIKVFEEKLNNEKEIVDLGIIEKRIRAKVEKKEGKLNAEQNKSLNAYTKKVKDMYVKKLHFPTEDFMVMILNKTTTVAWIAIPVSIVLAFFCAFYLIVSRHYAYHGLRYVVYGVLGAGAFIAVMAAAIVSNGAIYRYNISDSYLKDFYVYWIGHPLLMLVVFGIGVAVFGLIGIFLVYRQKYAVRQ